MKIVHSDIHPYYGLTIDVEVVANQSSCSPGHYIGEYGGGKIVLVFYYECGPG